MQAAPLLASTVWGALRGSSARALLATLGLLSLLSCGESGKASGASASSTASGGAGVEASATNSATGSAGQAGAAGATGDTGRLAADDLIEDVTVSIHDTVNTILTVTWQQRQPADRCWLEFEFDGSDLMTSRPKPCPAGRRKDVALGLPGLTVVRIRVVAEVDDVTYETEPYPDLTGPIPRLMPEVTVMDFDQERASPARWLLGAVEASDERAAEDPSLYFTGQPWLFIIDREGRVVWYYYEVATNAAMGFPQPARDGEYLWVDQSRAAAAGRILKMTLDQELMEVIDVPGLDDAIGVTDDGSVLYDVDSQVRELTPDGEERVIWDCVSDLGGNCYMNTVNYNPIEDSILVSLPYENLVVEIDRQSGERIGVYGSSLDDWTFAPPLESPPDEWAFGFPHFPNITFEGTLLVSSHMPGYGTYDAPPTPYQHAFIEFEIDRERRRLTELWRYTEGPEWPTSRGMAIRLDNGNTLVNYGTAGVIREVTPDKDTVFFAKFDLPGGDDVRNRMVGHTQLIHDLYSLNGGPE